MLLFIGGRARADVNHLRDVPWEDIFKFGASVATSEFCEQVRVEIDVENIRSSLIHLHGFQLLVLLPYFTDLYQKDKSFDSKVKFRQASICCKRVLEAAKLACANKTNNSITSQNLGSCDFWQIANSVLNKGKSAIPLLFSGLEVLPSASDKAQNCLLKTLLKTLILMTQISTCFPFYNQFETV